jgi:hypothetical protein
MPGGGQNQEYLSTFEIVWKKTNDAFFDPAFGGVDWKNLHDRYRPQIAAAQTDTEFDRVLKRWRPRSHFGPAREFRGEIEGLPELFLTRKTLLFLRKSREGETKVFSTPRGTLIRAPWSC